MSKMTHTAVITGCDARTPTNYRRLVQVRELKSHYVDANGTKYSKENGEQSSTYALYRLVVGSVKAIAA